MSSDYVPVNCEFHDRLESASVLGQSVRLRVRTEAGEEAVEGRILNVYVEGKEEFLLLEGVGPIRLDRVTFEQTG